ncbi:hypothetical protein GCM10010116_46250 [Microbispora rosea subsp. aerata]|nr:hypothetical protein GCM10010116_46250 [Microbispora rosea subsp. aerata]
MRVRYADAFIALLEDKIVTELLVLVSAESLPADPEPDTEEAHSAPGHPDHTEDTEDSDNAEDEYLEDVDCSGRPGPKPAEDSDHAEGAEDFDAAEHCGHPEGERPESTDDPESERSESVVRPEAEYPATAHFETTDRPAAGNGSGDYSGTCDSAADHPGAGDAWSVDRPATLGGERSESVVRPEAATAGNHPSFVDDFAADAAAGNCGIYDRPGICDLVTKRSESSDHPESDAAAGNSGSGDRLVPENCAAAAAGNPRGADCSETCHPTIALPEAGDEGADRSATFEIERADSGQEREDAQDAENAEVIEDNEAAEDIGDGLGREAARENRRAAVPADEAGSTPQHGHAQGQVPRSGESRWGEWRLCDPPGDACARHAPGDSCARHTYAGPRPAGVIPHGPGHAARPSSTLKLELEGSPATGPEASTHSGPGDPAGMPSGTASRPGSSAGTGTASGAAWGAGSGTARGAGLGAGSESRLRAASGAASDAGLGAGSGTASSAGPGAERGAGLGAPSGAGLGAVPGPGSPRGSGPGSAGLGLGVVPGLVPGLLLATGQVLPVSSVHRLARTSTLVRIVMDADGQVLDMGRKVRLATPAQRRAVFARYATCWVDGCPLPATLCQIDHADNWSSGGLTDLKLLGPACQFHNRDRYRHPDRYTRRKVGKDRWAFTYHRLAGVRRL